MEKQEPAVETEIDSTPIVNVVVHHPVYGALTRRGIGSTGAVEVYQDEQRLIYVFCNNLLRAIISPSFWEQGELSLAEFPDIGAIQIQSAGQPIINMPIKTEVSLHEDEFDVVIDDRTVPK